MFVRGKAVARVLDGFGEEGGTPRALVLGRGDALSLVSASSRERSPPATALRVGGGVRKTVGVGSRRGIGGAAMARPGKSLDDALGKSTVDTIHDKSDVLIRNGRQSPSIASETNSEQTWQTLESSNASTHGDEKESTTEADEAALQHTVGLPSQDVTIRSSEDLERPVNGQPSNRHLEEPQAITHAVPLARKLESNKQIAQLEAKLRILERKRIEDRDKLKVLEKLKIERDRFESIIQKLQAKLQPQQQELTQLKKQLQEKLTSSVDVQALQAEHDSALEMATLDREMAEETAEALRSEFDAMKHKLQELELEVEVLRDENRELSTDASAGDKESQGWLQMERSNERLKEALLRLRDLTQSQEADLKSEISGLQRDFAKLQGIEIQYIEAQQKLKSSEEAVESMRQQLDDAAGAQHMLEELTERNLGFQEQIEQLKVNIEELEDLKTLNDELEQSHIEAEKQLQDEVDFKDASLRDQHQKYMELEQRLADRDFAIARFRDVVGSLENRLEDLQAMKKLDAVEVAELRKRSLAVADMHMRLQESARKRHHENINLGLQQMRAAEAEEHLDIMQSYMHDNLEAERKSVTTYLCIKRIAYKAQLLHDVTKNTLADDAHEIDDHVFLNLDTLKSLHQILSLCQQLASTIGMCTPDEFIRYGGILPELHEAESSLDQHINITGEESMDFHVMSADSQRQVLHASPLATTLIQSSVITMLSNLTALDINEAVSDIQIENVLHRARFFVGSASSIIALLHICRRSLEPFERRPESKQTEVDDRPLHKLKLLESDAQTILISSRKMTGLIEEIRESGSIVGNDVVRRLEPLHSTLQAFNDGLRELAEYLVDQVKTDDAANSTHLTMSLVLSSFRSQLDHVPPNGNPLLFITNQLKALEPKLSEILMLLASTSRTQKHAKPPPPWVRRAEEIRAAQSATTKTIENLGNLRDSISQRDALLRLRDQSLEEQSIKIELLETRMAAAAAKAAELDQLQQLLEANKEKEHHLLTELEKSSQELATLRLDRDQWQKLAKDREPPNPDDEAAEASNAPTSRELAELHDELAALRGTVRHLHLQTRTSRLAHPSTVHMAWLTAPLVLPKSEAQKRRQRGAEGARDVLGRLLNLAAGAQGVDLAALPENKLAWRPARERSAWVVAREAERWRAWVALGEGVMRGERAVRRT